MDTSTAVAGSTPDSQPAANVPVQLTAAALTQVKTVIQAQGFQDYFFSIRVVPSGCSGLGYDLNLVKETKAGDQIWEQDGVKIATDALSAQYLSGTHIDYVTSITGAGFKFENPNAKSSCGCGTSFTT
ncbi:iron-sulfur cluster assembly accessory protein [Corallococcus sp. ZKHCc1 1396]|uniref:Iron-sulfur cluster assembly accessory protein n=1 Tax=Corallococcus soli TaxID=2710757 RepID=A0ABR9PX70_9BACT|nr:MULTISPECIES: iron-sulfur cluster assembly accessory protein [Corallococcus]MBE4752522.1 iron-sulfur cluster assembly accessory protein [Corallococcus soli]MCY1034336.1 iron-sulfur cluster assembly accessory protein [Corallococcus sp. BB11-1]